MERWITLWIRKYYSRCKQFEHVNKICQKCRVGSTSDSKSVNKNIDNHANIVYLFL